jgi:protein-S-isoprenylcysteine O-methyltransferase Ste14
MKKVVRFVVAVLVGTVLFIGLPLIGWGLGDWHAFLADPARLGYVVLTFIMQVAVAILVPGAGQSNTGTKTVARQRLAVLMLQIVPLVLVLSAPFSDRRGFGALGESAAVRFIGLALYGLGMALTNWAQVRLGRQFSVDVTIQENHQLVTDGPYRRLRHPRYLGILLFTIGIALVFRSWLGLILVAVLIGVLLWRIYDEEALMHAEFGEEWEAYCRTTKRLVPFIF